MPAGGSGELVFDISRASVKKIALPMKAGIENFLTDQQENKIKAEFDVKIMWLQPVGGSQALVSLSSDHSVTIPESVTEIENSAFYNCDTLSNVTFESGSQLASIGGSAFSSTGLTSIIIPASVTSIGNRAFSSCSSLSSVVLSCVSTVSIHRQ